mmetsp:Transcript_27691/g.74660  ORF Transcript_27691/g.74660 Transcript_27691/m.74660 type:complete len:229 (-) Transcript_27691:415-1101(-)|eukprot:5192000-Prymnesium_polylepis.2
MAAHHADGAAARAQDVGRRLPREHPVRRVLRDRPGRPQPARGRLLREDRLQPLALRRRVRALLLCAALHLPDVERALPDALPRRGAGGAPRGALGLHHDAHGHARHQLCARLGVRRPAAQCVTTARAVRRGRVTTTTTYPPSASDYVDAAAPRPQRWRCGGGGSAPSTSGRARAGIERPCDGAQPPCPRCLKPCLGVAWCQHGALCCAGALCGCAPADGAIREICRSS